MDEQKEKYSSPVMEIVEFEEADVITTSGVIELPILPVTRSIW